MVPRSFTFCIVHRGSRVTDVYVLIVLRITGCDKHVTMMNENGWMKTNGRHRIEVVQ